MPNLLLVDDDPSIREALGMALRHRGHTVWEALDSETALRLWRVNRPDLVLLDIMLPGTDGLTVCRRIREVDNSPIILLTARDDPVDVILGLEFGADDYVIKPVEPRVLEARIGAVLRRANPPARLGSRRFGDLIVDTESMEVSRSGVAVDLTPMELRLLLELAGRPGQVFTRELLLDRLWGYTDPGPSRLVDTTVQRLRSKIEDDPSQPKFIRTVRSVGYRFVRPEQA